MSPRAHRTIAPHWDYQASELNPATPSVRAAVRSERWKRRLIALLAFVAVPLCVLTGLGMLAQANAGAGELSPGAVSSAANDSPGKTAAYTALQAWLDAEPSALPGGRIISWDGYSTQEPDAEAHDSAGQPIRYSLETDRFTIEHAGLRYAASVLVGISPTGAAGVIGTPTLMPKIAIIPPETFSPWFGLAPTQAPAAVVDAVDDWARAFASGDPATLKRAIQDPDAGRSYLPLIGVTELSDARVTVSAFTPLATSESMLARVELEVTWATEDAAPSKSGSAPPVSYDVLISAARTATPFVVAWGAIGSGTALAPYVNGMAGVDLSQISPTGAPPGGIRSTGAQ